ncbi:MAG: alpha-2-macroglobulin [Verrucomicrobiales bacterium]|jgi:uncharacterized protein YfaS (alpha-2-macroglobulin family)|nr:alpha-2-macroglobulin [Verrucomicrobiales bacterium]
MQSPAPSFLEKLIGSIQWQAPFWVRDLKTHPKKLIGPVVLLTAVAALVSVSGRWLNKAPDADAVIVAAKAPELSSVEADGIHPGEVAVEFSKAALRLELVDQAVEQGIRISPTVKGAWRCVGDSRLVFQPAQDWAAGTIYQISLPKSLFADGVKLTSREVDFKTRPFTVSVEDAKFYLDPKNPELRQITATFQFTHPVELRALEKSVTISGKDIGGLLVRKGGAPLFKLELANHGRTAYFRSAPLNLPGKPVFANIEIAAGLSPSAGKALAKPVKQEVMIPDLYSFLKISNAQFTMVNDPNGEPRQTLMFNTGAAVSAKALQKNLSVWLLPKYNNSRTWRGPGEIDESVLAKAQRLDAKVNPTEQDYSELHSLTLDLPPNRQVYLKINRDLASLGGFVLKEDYANVLRVPEYPKEVRVTHDGAVLALSGERKLSVLTRGVQRVEFRLGKVADHQIHHLVSQSSGDFQNPYFRNYEFGEDNLSKVFYQTVTVSDDNDAKPNYLTLDFKELLGKNNIAARGLFFLEAAEQRDEKTTPQRLADGQRDRGYSSAWQNQYNDSNIKDRRFILITDLGLVVKDNADGTHDVFVQSVKNGAPVGDVTVSVLGKNGEVVARAETDADGHASLPRVLDLKREKRPVAFLARKGGDLSFLPFDRADRKLNLSRYDIGGLELDNTRTLTVFMFTERRLYRPGNDVHFGIIAKQYDWAGKLDGIPLELVITNPDGTVAHTEKLIVNQAGFLTAGFTTSAAGRTGTWSAEIYLVKANGYRERLLGSTTFRVEEFLPDRLKIKAALSVSGGAGWVSPRDLSVSVNLQNLYGAPAAGHRVNGELTLTPTSYSFKSLPDYLFHDPDADRGQKRRQHRAELAETLTSAAGDATLPLDIARFDQGVYRLGWFARGFEKEGGRNVSAAGDTLVSGREFLIGSKPDGDLGYLRLNSQRRVSFIAVDADLLPVTVSGLRLNLSEERHVSVLTKNANGNYAYQSVLKEQHISDTPLTVSGSGYDYALPTREPGNYVARIFSAAGETLSVVRFSVVGNANLSRSLEKNAELKIKLAKDEYQSGEAIQLSITAPYIGSGLITIEQDKVYTYKWFRAATTSSTQTITLPAGLEGSAYVTVTFLRAPDSPEIFTSPLSYAVAPFAINRDQRTTKITLTVPEKARPGQPLTVNYATDRPAKILIYAVDEGILQVARYTLPDPLGYFLQKRALQVGTSQILDQILPEYSVVRKFAAPGGDGEEELLEAGLNPFRRKTEAPVVYWSGILDADRQQRAVTYDVPDYFNGTLRVMAVAVSADAANSAEQKSFVKGPLIIQPNVPTFVAPNDEFEVTVSIANNIENSGTGAKVDVDLTVSGGLQIVAKAATPAVIAEGTDVSLRYKLKATRELGNATLAFTAAADDETARHAATLSVRPDSAYQTRVRGGWFDGGKKEIAVEREMYPQFRKLTVSASPLPLVLRRGLQIYLDEYPHWCSEQLTSRAFPTLLLGGGSDAALTVPEREKAVARIVGVLRARQNDQGAFGLWHADGGLQFDFPSVYAMHFLTEARERGYEIPSDMFRRGLAHLEDMAQGAPGDLTDARRQAYAIYILTRNQKITTNYLDRLVVWLNANDEQQWRNDLAGLYVAATYAMLHNKKDADRVLASFKLNQPPKNKSWDDFYTDLGRDAQYLYILARHFPEKSMTVSGDDWLRIAEPIARGEFVTHSAAYAILALSSQPIVIAGMFSASVNEKLKNGTTRPVAISGDWFANGAFSGDAKTLTVSASDNARRVFWQVTEAGFDLTPPEKVLKQGLEVHREYRDKTGRLANRVALGEELAVHIKLRSLADSDISNVAILDLLPGGFEVVMESIRAADDGKTNNGSLRAHYVDIREDRVGIYGTAERNATEYIYKIRATNRGVYKVPPVQAESMYRRALQARGAGGTLTVE